MTTSPGSTNLAAVFLSGRCKFIGSYAKEVSDLNRSLSNEPNIVPTIHTKHEQVSFTLTLLTLFILIAVGYGGSEVNLIFV